MINISYVPLPDSLKFVITMLMHMINSESQNNALCEESNKMDQSFEMSRSASGINPQTRKNLVVYIGVALATVVLIVCIVFGLASTENHNVGKY